MALLTHSVRVETALNDGDEEERGKFRYKLYKIVTIMETSARLRNTHNRLWKLQRIRSNTPVMLTQSVTQ